MTISVVQEKSVGGTTATTLTLTITGTQAGSVLVVGANANVPGGTLSFSDSSSDTFTDSGKGNVAGNVATTRMGAFLTCSTGVTTVTLTIGGGTPGFSELIAWEVAGLTSASFDKVVEAGGTTGTAMSSGATGTLSSASEIGIGYLISAAGCNGSSQGAGWTADEGGTGLTANQNFAEHIIVSNTNSITATATQASGSFDAWCVTLQSAAAVGDTPASYRSSAFSPQWNVDRQRLRATAQDLSSFGVETNPHWRGRTWPMQWAPRLQTAVNDIPQAVQVEAPLHFVPRTWPPQWNLNKALGQGTAQDFSSFGVETNPHWRSQTWAMQWSPRLQMSVSDVPLAVQPETNIHFVPISWPRQWNVQQSLLKGTAQDFSSTPAVTAIHIVTTMGARLLTPIGI